MENVDYEKLGVTKEAFEALEEGEQKKLLEEKGSTTAGPQKDEQEKQIRGLLTDLKEEREKRHTSEAKTEELNERIEALEITLEELNKTTISDEGFTGSPAEIKALVSQEVAAKEKAFKDELANLRTQILSDRLKLSEKATIEKYSPSKVGEEFAYEKVIKEGLQELIKQNPSYKEVVLRSDNPAEEAYRIGLTHPKFQALLEKKGAQGIVEQLTKLKPKTGVGSAAGATGIDVSKTSIEDLMKLKDSELDKLAGKK